MRSARIFVVLGALCFGLVARADEATARQRFEEGIAAASRKEWLEAVRLLEASIEDADKPAARYNLVVVNQELKRPLEVARHAAAFLSLAASRAHAAELTEVRGYLDEARRELAVLLLDDLPADMQLRVDDSIPQVRDGARLYVLPGLRRLTLLAGERPLEVVDIELRAGAVQAWPRVGRGERAGAVLAAPPARSAPPVQARQADTPSESPGMHLAPPPPPPSSAAWSVQKKTAWTLGISGAALELGAIASYVFALNRAEVLENWDPAREGYTNAANRYHRAAIAIYPLAVSAGLLLAGAAALTRHRLRAGVAVSITALVLGLTALGLGIALIAQAPPELVEGSQILRPTREAGALLLGVGSPLLTYGIRVQWSIWQPH